MWAEEVFYTLSAVQSTGNTAYADYYDVTINGVKWNVPGNQNFSGYWRIGGKSLSNTERVLSSKDKIESAISRIKVSHNGISNANLTVSSVKLDVASDAKFSNIIETKSLTPSFSQGTAGNFTFEATGGTWPTDSYYRITFIESNSKTSNYGVDFQKAEFYKGEDVADTRTAVNMTDFSAVSTTLIKGETTSTSVTNDQNSWTAAYTYESSNTSVATISNTGVITAVAKGTAKITATLNIANDDATWKKGATSSMSFDITVNNPSHNYTFISNNIEVCSGTCEEGSVITFPAENPSIDDVVFIGWAEAEISGTQDNAPDLVTSKNMGSADANFYAVFATADSQLGEPENKNLSFSLGSTMPTGWTKTASNAATGYLRLKTGEYAQADLEVAGIIPAGKILCSDNMDVVVSVGTYGSWTGTTKSVKITIDLLDANENVLATNYKTFSSLTSSESAEKSAISVTKPSDPTLIKYLRVTASDHNGGNEIRLKYVKPTYEICDNVSFTDYCTTVSSKATATLNIADADKNVALGYNGTKDVTISVNEAEYDGTLTVASSNEEVATVTYEGTTATIKYVGEGEAYISVTASSTANYYAINAPQAIKVTTTDDRSVAEVTINPETISVDNGSSADYSVTTAYNGTISVASDKPGVATVSYSEGKVTVEGKSVGTATLTISGEGNANYKPFSKEFAITVNKVVPVGIKNLRTQITGTSSSKSNYEAKLVNAVVTYVNGSNAYIEDGEAGILIYKSSHGFTAGDVLNGVVSGQGYVYNGLKELTSITGFTKTTDGEIPCTEVTLETIAANMQAWESRRVIVKDLTITEAMDAVTSRYGKVSQNSTEFNVYEKTSGCAGEKLAGENQVVASMICYPQDYNGVNTLSIWQESDINLIERADAQVVFNLEAGTGTNENPVAFTIGEDNTFPTAVVKDSEGNEIAGATVTYSTGNDAFISVDAETGVVTLKKYASKSSKVHVTATFSGNAGYKSATADYYLTIAKGQPVISFAQPNVEVALDGTANLAAIVDAKYGSLAVTYISSNPEVASFANENNPTLNLNAEGTTTISAKTVTNDAWNQSESVSYTLTVTAPVAGYAYVTLDACGNDVEGYTEPIKVVKGRTVMLPAATTTKNEYTFLGWTSKEVTKTTAAPALVANNYVADADVTLYPVFSMEEGDGSSDTEIGWILKGLNELDLTSTVLIISTSGSTSRILSADQGSTGYFTGRDITVENGIVTSDAPANSDWIISKEGDNYSFKSNNNGYLYNKGCSYSNYERWALSANGEKTYSMESLGGSPYNHSGSYVYLDDKTWNMTTDASFSKIQFFQFDEYDVPGSTITYYVSRTMNVLELDENATEIAEIYDEYDKVIVHRTIKAGNWNTLCLPFAMTPTQIAENFGADAEVKILTGLTVNGDSYSMQFSDCDEIGAGLPCMIRVSKAISTITVEGTVEVDTIENSEDRASDSSNDNKVTFVGNYAKITVPMNEGNYIINSNKFYFVNSEVTNKGFRGYFNLFSLDGSNSNKMLSFDFDGTITNIDNINIEGLDDNIFDLQGRRVQRLQKGVNIVNGRKVIR